MRGRVTRLFFFGRKITDRKVHCRISAVDYIDFSKIDSGIKEGKDWIETCPIIHTRIFISDDRAVEVKEKLRKHPHITSVDGELIQKAMPQMKSSLQKYIFGYMNNDTAEPVTLNEIKDKFDQCDFETQSKILQKATDYVAYFVSNPPVNEEVCGRSLKVLSYFQLNIKRPPSDLTPK